MHMQRQIYLNSFSIYFQYTWYQPAVEIQGNKKIKLGRLARGCLHDRNSNYKSQNRSDQNLVPEATEESREQDLLSEAARKFAKGFSSIMFLWPISISCLSVLISRTKGTKIS